jgi:phosphoribosylformimino-5-aminoimidazole carboxamide ribotide isomerase
MSKAPPVEIVPVIDLKGGVVVRAKAGDRAQYQPIVTPLSDTPDPVAVAEALVAAVGARRLYIADLDAIERKGDATTAVAVIARRFPQIELWIDGGVATFADAERVAGFGRVVLGSESQSDEGLLRQLGERAVLSLDYRGDMFVGPAVLRDEPRLWPRDVIVMTLARVGADAGPDLAKLGAARRARPDARFFAAGGVRGPADLAALAELGIEGALVATAIHDRRLGRRPGDADRPRASR